MAVSIFFCYAREDEALLNKLKTHLKSLEREGIVDIWHDRDISAGAEWEKEINEHLNTAQIILLLISPDFMASEFCYSKEMTQALERHERGASCVIPIILRPVYWQQTPFGKLQALPTDGKPVTSLSWHNLDEAFFDVARGIHIAAENIKAHLQAPSESRIPQVDGEKTKSSGLSDQGRTSSNNLVISYRGFRQVTRGLDQRLRFLGQQPDEKLRIVLRWHPWFLLRSIFPLLISLAILLIVLFILSPNSALSQYHLFWVLIELFMGFLIAFSFFYIVYMGFVWWYGYSIVTDKRIFIWSHQRRSLNFTYKEIFIENVKRIEFQQTNVWSNLLNYGNIHIYLVEGELLIKHITSPTQWFEDFESIYL